MASSSTSLMQACMLLLVVAVAISWSGGTVDGISMNAERNLDDCEEVYLEFYMHGRFVSVPGYEATDLLIANPSGNTSAYAFGNFGVSDQVLREGVSNISLVIGRAPGTFQAMKEYKYFAMFKLLTLLTDEYDGTIVVFCDWDSEAASTEWTVIGGTGTFRMATGYAVSELADGSPTGDYLTYLWKVYLQVSSSSTLTCRPIQKDSRYAVGI